MITATQRLLVLGFAAAASLPAHAARAPEDAGIAASVEAALDGYAAVCAASIQVQSIRHVVYLHGLVDTYPLKLLVQSVAENTPGVERVVNSLELRNE